MLPVLAKGRPVCWQPTFEFPNTAEGRKSAGAFRKAIEEGEAVTVPGKYIKKFEASDWWQRAFGNELPLSISILSSPKPKPKPFLVKLVATLDDRTQSFPIELHLVKAGTKILRMNNHHEVTPIRIDATLPLVSAGQNTELKFNLEVNFPGHSIPLALDAARVLRTILDGGSISLVLPNGSRLGPSSIAADRFGWTSNQMRAWENILTKLSFIESRAGHFGRFRIDNLQDKDLEDIEQLYNICRTGKYEVQMSTSFVIEKSPPKVKINGDFRISIDAHIEVLGVNIPLGPTEAIISVDKKVQRAINHPKRVKGKGYKVQIKNARATLVSPDWSPPNSGPKII